MKKDMIKAEMWDRMQFLFRSFYDRMVHLLAHIHISEPKRHLTIS